MVRAHRLAGPPRVAPHQRRTVPLDAGEQARSGALRLTTIGRRSGQERTVIVGYLEDGSDLLLLAMNGWDEGQPAWLSNLEAHPDAVVRLAGQEPRPVRARLAVADERDRLWQRWVAVDPNLDVLASRRTTPTAVVVLEPAGPSD